MWTVEYNNDVGPDDDGFWEWWEVTDGKFIYKANKEFEARELADAMNNREAARAATLLALVATLEQTIEWISDHSEEMDDGHLNTDAILDDARSVLRMAKSTIPA